MDVALELARARARAALELRARMGGGRGRKPKKQKGLARPAKVGPGAGCGTGKGGFQSGNVCALEDGIPDKPKTFAKGGALKKSNPKADREKAAKLKAKAAAKTAAKQTADKKKSIEAKRKKAAIRKKQKAEKEAADKKASEAAAAKKKQEMLQKIRVKKANKQIEVVGTPKSVAEQIKEAKTSLASKKLVVVKTPKSIKEEIDEAKAAIAAKEAAAKAKAEANAQAAYEKAKIEAAAAEKASAEIAAKRAAEKGKPVPVKKVDDPEDLAPKPPFTTPNPDQLTTVKTLGGSTGAVLAEANGQKFVVKAGKTPGHIANESQVDELYEAAGVTVPRQQLHTDANGVQKKVAEFINGKTLGELKVQDKAKYDAAVKKLQKDFVADVLFSNYDVVGMNLDNIVVKGGKVYRVDNGGSLAFRAQGKNKPFTDDISEINSLRNQSINASSASVFGSLSDKEISTQITKLLKKKEAILAAAKTQELRDVLEKRMAKMQAWQKQHKLSAKQQKSKPSAKPGYSTEEQLTAKVPEGVPKTTGAGWSWPDRQALRHKIEPHLTSAEKAALHKWGGSSLSVKHADKIYGQDAYAKADQGYRDFVSALEKLPQFKGGTVYRGMKHIDDKLVDRWISSGKFRHAYSDAYDNTTHASMSTSKAKATHFSKATSGRILVKVTKTKRAKDSSGLIFNHPTEQEVFALPGAEYRIKSWHWQVSTTKGALGFKNGQKVTEDQWTSALGGKYGSVKPGYMLSGDSRLLRVIEVEEI